MKPDRKRFLSIAVIMLLLCVPAPLESQTILAGDQSQPVDNKSSAIALSIALVKSTVMSGQTPRVLLTVTNLRDKQIRYPLDKVHVEGEQGEPPTTLLQRRITGTLRPGEYDLNDSGGEPSIGPGKSFTRGYNLTDFYDLSQPGTYTVYIDVLDEPASRDNAGVWVRSPLATFIIQPPLSEFLGASGGNDT